MKNKEPDVIGQEGSVITVRVKRSDISEVVGRDSEFKSEYGDQGPPLMQMEGYKG